MKRRLAGLACSADPERWFDAADHRDALLGCLACPQRRWCAGQALSSSASFGMWAGIWINDDLAEVSEKLKAIASMPGESSRVMTSAAPSPHIVASPTPTDVAASPTPMPDTVCRRVMAVVSARSSGHCEAMTPHCRFTFDTLGSRVPGRSGWSAASAGAVYAACRPCEEAIRNSEPHFARRLGYVVDPPYDPSFTAFYWRQAQWVYLDGGPRISPIYAGLRRAQ
jgi:hypothetical protein